MKFFRARSVGAISLSETYLVVGTPATHKN